MAIATCFLGLAILDESDAGVAMMFRIQQRSPGSPLAERALLKTANYYFDNQDFDLSPPMLTSNMSAAILALPRCRCAG